MNKVILIGRLTKAPTLAKTQSGTSVTSFTLAVPKDKERTDWIPCVAYKATAELICKYVGKGQKIACDGIVNTRNYEDKSGKKVYVTEILVNSIEFVESKKEVSDADGYTDEMSNFYDESPSLTIDSDDLPF